MLDERNSGVLAAKTWRLPATLRRLTCHSRSEAECRKMAPDALLRVIGPENIGDEEDRKRWLPIFRAETAQTNALLANLPHSVTYLRLPFAETVGCLDIPPLPSNLQELHEYTWSPSSPPLPSSIHTLCGLTCRPGNGVVDADRPPPPGILLPSSLTSLQYNTHAVAFFFGSGETRSAAFARYLHVSHRPRLRVGLLPCSVLHFAATFSPVSVWRSPMPADSRMGAAGWPTGADNPTIRRFHRALASAAQRDAVATSSDISPQFTPYNPHQSRSRVPVLAPATDSRNL